MEKKPVFNGPKRPGMQNNRNGSAPEQNDHSRRGNDRNNKDAYRVNEGIYAREVRLVGDNVEQGVYPIDKALRIAQQLELDLIEISPNAVPPVCRILDYQKFMYQQRKRQKEQKQKAAKVVVKEIRFGPQTDDHDYNFKLKHAIGFLKEGSKVKAYVFFRGRSILFKEQGEVLLLRFANDLEDYGKVEMMPVLEGKRMTIMISPLKATQKKDNKNNSDKKPKEAPKPENATPPTQVADTQNNEED